jgi:AAA family ATPase
MKRRLARVRHSLTADQVDQLAASAHGFVSADLAALVDEAALCALRRFVASSAGERSAERQQQEGRQQPGETAALSVDWCDFQAAAARIKPSALREVAVEVPRVSLAR